VIRALLLALALVLLAVGCGKVRPKTPNSFTLEATQECLEDDAGYRTSTERRAIGFIGWTASGGAVRAYVGGNNSVVVVFGESDQEAADIVSAFRRVTPDKKRAASLLEPRGNAVINWISEPTPGDLDAVRNCLE
jgi:hypothetical protein